ncbi:MAG: hypothetical protein IH587_12010 [Anaerolineae bacterium]|nr:hypothetical protein [Anaerolineae bacterium]
MSWQVGNSMSDVFQKLNVLLRAGMRDLVGDDPLNLSTIRNILQPEQLGKDFEHEVAALREKINEALDYEEMLSNRVKDLQAEVERLDAQADRAVELGEQDRARTLLAQQQRAAQRLSMAESDLREHRFVTQELIQRVNQLESVVADASAAQEPPTQIAADDERNLAAVLRQAREQVLHESAQSTSSAGKEPADTPATEADLDQRRRRLSKPSP